LKKSSVDRSIASAFSSWDDGWWCNAIACFNSFGHRPIDPFLIRSDPEATTFCFAHCLNEPLVAVCGVRLPALRLAVLQDVLALSKVAIVTMFLKILPVNPHLSHRARCSGLGCRSGVSGYLLELDPLTLLPNLAVCGDSTDLGQCICTPSFALRSPRDRAGLHKLASLEANGKRVV